MVRYMEYLEEHHLNLSKLIASMNPHLIKPSLQVYFREASILKAVVPDWKIFEVQVEHADREIRSKLNAFARTLWSM